MQRRCRSRIRRRIYVCKRSGDERCVAESEPDRGESDRCGDDRADERTRIVRDRPRTRRRTESLGG